MDKLAKQLCDDAADIKASVSPELDYRIRASLEGITPEQPETAAPKRPRSLWWASSLTGVAAAAAIIAVINLTDNGSTPADGSMTAGSATGPAVEPLEMLELNTDVAVLMGPLEQELANLEADLRKAEEAVRKDIGM